MRPRFVVLASLLAALIAAVLPGLASAHPRHNHGLTIATTPNPINSGDGVLIYGALRGTDLGGQTINLYHRVGDQHGFTLVGHTTTDSVGFYDFPRADGVVTTNRSWFVRGPGDSHSRTVHERVAALVNLSSNISNAVTFQPVEFTGQVSPAHPSQKVLLQRQRPDGGWRTIGSTYTTSASSFTIPHRFALPGVFTLRALIRGNVINIDGESSALTITVQQRQVPSFSINSSDPIISEGQSVMISGTLDQKGTNMVEPNTGVTLFGRTANGPEQALGTTVTSSSGSYSFNETPTANEVYFVRTTVAPYRYTARLFEGVRSVVSLTTTTSTVAIGQPVTFTGTVSPNLSGHLVYLQRQNADGVWHNIAVSNVTPSASFSFTRAFGLAGTRTLRAVVAGAPENVAGVSTPVTITVTGTVAPPSTLPPAS